MGSIRLIQKDLDSHPEGREDSGFCCTSLDSVITVVKWRWGQQSPSGGHVGFLEGPGEVPAPISKLLSEVAGQRSAQPCSDSELWAVSTDIWVAFHQYVCSVCEQSENKATVELHKSKKAMGMNSGLLEMLFFLFGITPATRWNILIHLPNEKAEVEN